MEEARPLDEFDEVIENQLCAEVACAGSVSGDDEDPPELQEIVTQLCDANREKHNKIRETWVARQLLQMYKEEVAEARAQMQTLNLSKEQLLRDKAQLEKDLQETRQACEQVQIQIQEAYATSRRAEPGIAAYRQGHADAAHHLKQRQAASQQHLQHDEQEPGDSPCSQSSGRSSNMHIDLGSSTPGGGSTGQGEAAGDRGDLPVCRSLISQISIRDFTGMEEVLAAKLCKADLEINRLKQEKEHEFQQRQQLEEMNLLMLKKIGRLQEFFAHLSTGGRL